MNKEEILALPEIKREDFRLLWYSNYWDGMLSGMLLYEGKKYWFSCFDEASDHASYDVENDIDASGQLGWYRRFKIIELTENQLKEAEYWNDLFCKYVGVYTNYGEDGKPLGRDFPRYVDKHGINFAIGARPPELHHIYYDIARQVYPETHSFFSDDFKNNKVIGWFHN